MAMTGLWVGTHVAPHQHERQRRLGIATMLGHLLGLPERTIGEPRGRLHPLVELTVRARHHLEHEVRDGAALAGLPANARPEAAGPPPGGWATAPCGMAALGRGTGHLGSEPSPRPDHRHDPVGTPQAERQGARADFPVALGGKPSGSRHGSGGGRTEAPAGEAIA